MSKPIKRYKKDHNRDGWPVHDTATGKHYFSRDKDDLVEHLNAKEQRIKELEEALLILDRTDWHMYLDAEESELERICELINQAESH